MPCTYVAQARAALHAYGPGEGCPACIWPTPGLPYMHVAQARAVLRACIWPRLGLSCMHMAQASG